MSLGMEPQNMKAAAFSVYSSSTAHRSSQPNTAIMVYFDQQAESECFLNVLCTSRGRHALGRVTCLGMSTKEEAASRVKVCRVTMTILVEGQDVTSCCSSCRELEAKLASWCMCCRIGISFSFKSTGVAKPAVRKETQPELVLRLAFLGSSEGHSMSGLLLMLKGDCANSCRGLK